MSNNTNAKTEEKKAALVAAIALMESGYAGMSKNGCIVDRRKHRDASPIMGNALLGIGKPKALQPLAVCHGCLDEIPTGEEQSNADFKVICQGCLQTITRAFGEG